MAGCVVVLTTSDSCTATVFTGVTGASVSFSATEPAGFSGQRLLKIRETDGGDFYARLGLEEGDLATLREDHWLRGGYQGFTGEVELDEGPPGEIRVPQGDLSGIRLPEGRGVVVRRLL